MNSELLSWLDREAKKKEKVRTLENCLVTNNLFEYSFYRLRYFSFTFFFSYAVHVIQILYLKDAYSGFKMAELSLLLFSSSLVYVFLWGALEVCREDIRDYLITNRKHLIPRAVHRWVNLAIRIALLLALIALVLLSYLSNIENYHMNLATFWFVAILLLSIPMRIFALTLQASMYGIYRIYRTPWSIVLPDILATIFLLLAWQSLREWAIVISFATQIVLQLTLMCYYTLNAYQMVGWLPLRVVPVKASFIKETLFKKSFWLSGVSAIAMKIEFFLLIFLYSQRTFQNEISSFFFIMLILAPVLNGVHSWAQLFYFDFKKLDLDLYHMLRRKFEYLTILTSLVVAFIFSGIAWIVIFLSQDTPTFKLLFAFALYLVSRSVLAILQMRAYSEMRHALLGSTFAICLMVIYVCTKVSQQPYIQLLGISLGFIFVSLLFFLCFKHIRYSGKSGVGNTPTGWLSRISELLKHSSVTVCSIELIKDMPTGVIDFGLQKLGHALGDYKAVMALSTSRIYWYHTDEKVIDYMYLAKILPGIIFEFNQKRFETLPEFTQELKLTRGIFPFSKEFTAVKDKDFTKEEIRELFQKTYPTAITYQFESMDEQYDYIHKLKHALNLGTYFARRFSVKPRISDQYAVADSTKNGITTLFVIPSRITSMKALRKIKSWEMIFRGFLLRQEVDSWHK